MLTRPRPPSTLTSIEGLTQTDRFVPESALSEWIREVYLETSGAFYEEGLHDHLRDAVIGCLWTNCENVKHQRRIAAQCEMPAKSGGSMGKWARARSDQQLFEWFGRVPDFLLTFDAVFADQAEDAQFAALVDHELCHASVERDEFGAPKFNKVTGLPKFCVRGHDVSEFTSVVRRFGIEAAGPEAVEFVIAASKAPAIGRARIEGACGSCLRIAA